MNKPLTVEVLQPGGDWIGLDGWIGQDDWMDWDEAIREAVNISKRYFTAARAVDRNDRVRFISLPADHALAYPGEDGAAARKILSVLAAADV